LELINKKRSHQPMVLERSFRPRELVLARNNLTSMNNSSIFLVVILVFGLGDGMFCEKQN
jgi:hypothetical protein